MLALRGPEPAVELVLLLRVLSCCWASATETLLAHLCVGFGGSQLVYPYHRVIEK